MNFPSIDIQGSILSAELLGKIRSEQANHQQGKDFSAELNNSKLKDEISLAWQDARAQWIIFNNKLKRVKEGETAASETRSFWILPLLSNLGYDFQYLKNAEELNGKTFWINNRDNHLDGFPLFIAGFNESLDKRPDTKSLRVSPHALVQEYLNYSEHLYGLVTNGKQLRLLRDASRLTRLSYVEFNLEKMMEEDLYSDFVLLYRVLHASRMPLKKEAAPESIIEKYHQEGLATGSAIRNKLGDAVKLAILNLANGFINHPDNYSLRELLASGKLNKDDYYRHQLRIIYRLLFLFVIEERNLVYAESKTPQTKRFAQIYYNYYSLMRLRKLSRKLKGGDAGRHHDLWQGLMSTFALFEKKESGEKLGIMSLQGDLFGYHAINGAAYDLHVCQLDNGVLLDIIQSLCYFENENKVLIAVNYGGLDVEEFGSVYEGLLELKLKADQVPGTELFKFEFDKSGERGKSGSHYTPEELVQPLIKHSLEYLIEDRIKAYQEKKETKENTIKSLLDLKICDVACGSGHILLSAARRLALEIARVQSEEEQPNPVAMRRAMKDVVRSSIYGVDKNPLAVELCKIALWLEAYNPGEPLNFLDHHIKWGDAIVGLAHRDELENGIADEAFKTLPGDEKEVASALAKQNKAERKINLAKGSGTQISTHEQLENTVQESMEEYGNFNRLPERTTEEIEVKQRAYKNFIFGQGFSFLKTMADTQVAQFFIPKTTANKNKLITDSEYRLILAGQKGWQGPKTALASAVAQDKRIFHWFLEFPEVFNENGFDCVLGNPPFLGGKKITTALGERYLAWIKNIIPEKGSSDLVGYFFRRIFYLTKEKGFQSLIASNTISQADTREVSLDVMVNSGGEIVFGNKNIEWPGVAAVSVTLVTLYKGSWLKEKFIKNTKVQSISPYIDDATSKNTPFVLKSNSGLTFIGNFVLGKGFILDKEKSKDIITHNPSYTSIIKPYLTGDDINSNPTQLPTRDIIFFRDWTEEKCKTEFPICWDILVEKVKPQRDEIIAKSKQIHTYNFWQFWDLRPNMYKALETLKFYFAISRVTKQVSLSQIEIGCVPSEQTVVYAFDDFYRFAVLSSTMHEIWSWKNSSTMGANTLRYSPTDCFETFPFPDMANKQNVEQIEKLGNEYCIERKLLMSLLNIGLTKTYNLLHSQTATVAEIVKICKVEEDVALNALTYISNLHRLQKTIDKTVMETYNWQDVILHHNFYEVEYLPENDRTRYTIHPDARKEILKRLLELNHKIYEEELRDGKHSLKAAEEFFKQKNETVPAEVIEKYAKEKKEKAYKIKKSKSAAANEDVSIYKQSKMFGEPNLFEGGGE